LNNNDYYDDQTEIILSDLKTAIIQKKLETVKSLLQTHDLDVNVILKNEWTPLMYASSCGSYELCEYLIENGADVFFSDGFNNFSIVYYF
jgi:ankyrin repeat protein